MSSTHVCPNRSEVLTSGGRELLKWIALVLMTGDHVNKVLWANSYPWLGDISRVVFPIFAIVLAYNVCANPDPKALNRSMLRTLATAVLVQPAYALAFGGEPLPLNVLFTLVAGCYVATEPNRLIGVVVALVAGCFVDYAWWGIAVVVAAAHFFRVGGGFVPGALLLASVALLAIVNGNGYALLAFPLVALLGSVVICVPRWRWTFLGYYVVHVAVLAVIAGNSPAAAGY